MARIRTIKPEFFTSEDICSLSTPARLLYIAIWCEADKEGRLVWKPKTLKLRYLPGDEVDIDALCGELTAQNLIVCYGNSYAYVPAFKAHQHLNPRESESQLPEPPHVDASSRVGTRHRRVSTGANLDAHPQGGREGKGREGKVIDASVDASPDGVDDSVWRDFLKTRKTKMTKTALDEIRAEAGKAGVSLEAALRAACAGGWQGFKAAWLADVRTGPGGAAGSGGAPPGGVAPLPPPGSLAAVRAIAAGLGLPPWDELAEQFPQYRERVMAAAAGADAQRATTGADEGAA